MLWFKTLVGVFLQAIFLALFIYVPAGTLYWSDALIWAAVFYAINSSACIYLLLTNPRSIEARLNLPSANQPKQDKIATAILFSAIVISLIACPLDVFHFQVTPAFTGTLKISGLAVFVLGLFLIIASMAANEFAESTVNIQKDRGQKVVDTGVYGLVRHPMYTGFVLFFVGTSLWLGTVLSLVICITSMACGLFFRIRVEEKTLLEGLDGYEEYSKKVKFKLIPFLI
ncbi:MAG: hypothetical protein CMQ39_04660 [Gammaproteobacteria bacterium]|nr:hypothetical protein [Gammaproteobacteria bacterium]